MALTLEQQHKLIERFDQEYRESPRKFKTKLTLLAACGYLFLYLTLFLSLAFLGGLIWLNYSIGWSYWFIAGYLSVGFFVFSTIRSLLVRLPLPPGAEISEQDFPYIFEVIESLRKPMRLRRARIRVLFDWEFNAFAFSRPVFGMFGPSRLYIGIGLPLVAALSEKQLKTVLAHELAHYSRKHSHFNSKMSRLRLVWCDFFTRIKNRPISGIFFYWFANKYFEYFNSAASVLSKYDEFEADKVAASVTDARTCAQVDLRMAVRSNLVIEEYWNDVWRHALVSDEPSRKTVSRLIERLSLVMNREDAIEELRWKLGDSTQPFDSHPCLRDRIEALGVNPPGLFDDVGPFLDEWSLIRPENSLHKVMHGYQRGAELFLDAVWTLSSYPAWTMTYLASKPLTSIMVKLDKEWKEKGKLPVEKAWRRASITIEYYGPRKAQVILDYILKIDENHPHANYFKGRHLLEQRDSLGILHIETAIENDPLNFQESGLAALSDYYRRMGSAHDSLDAKYQSFEANEETKTAIRERERMVRSSDNFLLHGLSEEEVQEMIDAFSEIKEIDKVYLVKKEVEHFSESPLYIFGVTRKWWTPWKSRLIGQKIIENIAFSRDQRFVRLGNHNFFLRKKIKEIDHSLIYSAKVIAVKRKAEKEAAQKKANEDRKAARIAAKEKAKLDKKSKRGTGKKTV